MGHAVGHAVARLPGRRPASWPSPGFLDDEPVALIQNIWTQREHRRRGLAGEIVKVMVGRCRERGIRRLFLNATEDGRRVYVGLALRPSTAAMSLTLEIDDYEH